MDYDPERSEQSNVTMSEGPLELTTCPSLPATVMQPPREVVLLMDAISILNLGVELILPALSGGPACSSRRSTLLAVCAMLSRSLGSCFDVSRDLSESWLYIWGLVEFDSLGSRGRLTTKGGV